MQRLLVMLSLAGAGLWLVPDAAAQRRDRNRVTAEEMAEKPEHKTAIDLIRVLRPQWLRVRPSGNIGGTAPDRYGTGRAEPAVYVDETRMPNGLEELRNVSSSDLVEMRYLTGNQALARYGTGHEYGAIFVVTVRRKP